MHQTVSRYTTGNKTESILVEVYNTISKSYAKRAGDEQIQVLLGHVKKTLAESRKSTLISFMCFKGESKGGGEVERRVKKHQEAGGSNGASTIPPGASTEVGRIPTPRPPRRPRDRPVAR
jgi:hypothetical protein